MKGERNRIGAISLGIAAVGFLAVSFQPWLALDRVLLLPALSLKRLLSAFFDAALVGSLADWFAVSALFRDPLGLRLPHTNILAKNKDAIAEAVPRFITTFISDDKIGEELHKLDFAAKVREALRAGGFRTELHEFLRVRASTYLLGFGDPEADRREGLNSLVGQLSEFASERLDAASAFAGLLRWARREEFDERILESIADFARTEIGRNRYKLAATITPIIKRNAGWQGLFIGRGTIEGLLRGVEDELGQLRADRSHELRRFVISTVERYAAQLADEVADPSDERGRFAGMVREALRKEGFVRGLSEWIASLLRTLGQDLTSSESGFLGALDRIEDSLAERLGSDDEFRSRFNASLADLTQGILTRSKLVDSLTDYLIGLLKATDSAVFVDRVEEAVWNDLQYIRVNGAVVGGLVGLVLAFLGALLPQ
ncbi:MAG TPA: DUF445 family protein [Rectinemataceae bacterium]|nr:DUF445 family protein [Rectinemataceae bacterium]